MMIHGWIHAQVDGCVSHVVKGDIKVHRQPTSLHPPYILPALYIHI